MLLLLLLFATSALSSPVPSKKDSSGSVLYDQRQEGELNVRADLKNFVFMIIPTFSHSGSGSTTSVPNLLDFLMKSASPSRSASKESKPQNKNEPVMHFIEGKTAPYHVDISTDRSHLASMEPDEVIIANSPIVDGSNRNARMRRLSRAFVFELPKNEEFVVTKTEDVRKVVKKDGLRKKEIKVPKEKDEIKLLGATEQCGPSMHRDSQGICRIKN